MCKTCLYFERNKVVIVVCLDYKHVQCALQHYLKEPEVSLLTINAIASQTGKSENFCDVKSWAT